MLKSNRKHLILSAIADNKRPQRSRSSGDLLLPLDDKTFTKLQRRGKTTPAGRFFFSQTQTTPDTYDIEGTVVQRGSTEYLLTNGKARVLRRLIGNSYTYSRLGKQYFQHKKTTYLVHVPAVIKKAFSRSQGRQFMVPHNAFMFEEVTVSANYSETERRHQLKSKVLSFMEQNLDTLDGKSFCIMTVILFYMLKKVHGRLTNQNH